VQLAAAFFFASLLANVRIIAAIFVDRTREHSSQPAGRNPALFLIHRSGSISSQLAGWGIGPASKLAGSKSGSKLRALQSFAPIASDGESKPVPARLVTSSG